ncbi:ArsB/NhaD family transporter [Gorillibacterium sp. CAU 1737]|uniref:ArsB/NhaD family transporter n=1 Tax=Gorillibacterium sp. CAU 1737 TaxID=3140362 RepID=UPI00325FE631
MEQQAYWAIGIFLVTYAWIISEKVHRTIVAMLGGIVVLATGIVSQETVLQHIDFNTLGLLIGMMILVSITADTGIFRYAAVWAARRAKGEPMRLLLLLTTITAVSSAFLDNVTTVMLLVPVTFSITKQLKVNPMPFLLAQIMASNIGGTATLIGDPPNIMIGSAAKELTFLAFIQNLTPIILLVLAVYLVLFYLLFRKQLQASPERKQALLEMDMSGLITNRRLLVKSLSVLAVTILGFFLHQAIHLESATVALGGAFLLLLLTGEKAMEQAFTKVEWMTIFFFIGLFVLVASLVETGVIGELAKKAMEWTGGDSLTASMLILWMSALASAFMDNIPFVATMIPLIQEMGQMGVHNLEPLWWSLALGACLGGNGTLIGASANLVVAGLSAKEGHPIRFVPYLKLGFPLMILSIVLSSGYIYLRYFG